MTRRTEKLDVSLVEECAAVLYFYNVVGVDTRCNEVSSATPASSTSLTNYPGYEVSPRLGFVEWQSLFDCSSHAASRRRDAWWVLLYGWPATCHLDGLSVVWSIYSTNPVPSLDKEILIRRFMSTRSSNKTYKL